MEQVAEKTPIVGALYIVEARGVTRDFRSSGGVVHALRGIDLCIYPGELVALRGRSGSGKTTLLNILVGLDDPTQGASISWGGTWRHWMRLHGHACAVRASVSCSRTRISSPRLLPRRMSKYRSAWCAWTQNSAQRARQVLERVGLGPRVHHRGVELSGGEQQRVALARALVHEPRFTHDMRNELPKETPVEPKQPDRPRKPLQMWTVLFDRCPFG